MSEDGIKQTPLVTEFRFIKEELQILDPLNRQKKDLEKSINEFVVKKVLPRLNLEANQKYQVIFDIDKNSIRIKHMKPYMPVNRTNWQDILGKGKATRAR